MIRWTRTMSDNSHVGQGGFRSPSTGMKLMLAETRGATHSLGRRSTICLQAHEPVEPREVRRCEAECRGVPHSGADGLAIDGHVPA